jgi:two-component system response regulator ChvI
MDVLSPSSPPPPPTGHNPRRLSDSSSDHSRKEDASGDEIHFIDSKNLCIGIVDMINSTKITADIRNSEKVAKYYSIFINTMAAITRNFGAEVIKNVGDSLIFLFPKTSDSSSSSSFNNAAFKDVLECGLTMQAAYNAINEKYYEEGLPSVNYRISADYGKVEIAKSGPSPQIYDVFGPTVNMCAKINSKAPPNGMIIGGDLYRMVKELPHTWSFPSIVFKEIGEYSVGDSKIPPYPLYQVSTDAKLSIPANIHRPHSLRSKPSAWMSSSLLSAAPSDTASKPNVMLIDDEPDMVITYKSFLSAEGYKVETFTNSQEALRHFAQMNPSYYDLVVMDIRMPNLNGLQLYYRMKAINSSIRVLFVSALDAVEELVSILPDIKHNNILRKPVDKDHFVRSVQIAISQ